MARERTLSIVKPDGVARNLIGEVYRRFESQELRIIAARMLKLSEDQAGLFYAVHRERAFFPDLVRYMSSGPVIAQVLEGEQPVVEELMRSIDKDPRHMRLKIIRTVEEPRRFTGWSMAYTGYASFIDRNIAPLFSSMGDADAQHLALRLISLMEEFTRMAPA